VQQYDLQHFGNSGRNDGDNLTSVW